MSPLERCDAGHDKDSDTVDSLGQCRRCKRQKWLRLDALKRGLPLCPEGHGLVAANLAEDGSCAVCTPPPQPAPLNHWLDWAVVYRALQNEPLVRPLTNYELVCAITTVGRRNSLGPTRAAAWLRANTRIPISNADADYLMMIWVVRRRLPLLTVHQAITYENPPDKRLAMRNAAA